MARILIKRSNDALLRLDLLGGFDLRGLPESRALALGSRPKLVALLLFLALSSARGLQSRERVLALLWPDGSPKRARGALRNALHGLRSLLGRNTILAVGDALGVDLDHLECDAVEFDRRLSEGRVPQAMALYRGDLVPGFRVRGARPFEQWLDVQRDGLRTRAAEASWALAQAEQEQGHWITAADHARRAVGLSGGDEESVRRLMALLARAGDRVAALREYEAFVTGWRRDYDLEPSRETVRLAEAIRAEAPFPDAFDSLGAGAALVSAGRGAGDPGPATGPVPRLSGSAFRVRIAVLPFLRIGAGGATDHLATGLADGVISALARLSGVRVVARSSVDRLGSAEGRRMALVREQLGADVVVDGSLRVSGDRLTLVARLIDAPTDRPLWGDVFEAPREDLLTLESELVLTILRILDVPLTPEQERHVARRPTANPDAYELYLRGRQLWNLRSRTDLDQAVGLYERALALDNAFALPLVGLADAYLLSWTAAGVRVSEARVRARDCARQALDLDPQLGEAHATLGLLRCAADHDWHGAETELLRAIELSPGYATGRHWYGGVLSWVFRRYDDGARQLELARQLDPLSPIIHNDIGLALLNRGRSRQAIGKFEEALALEPEFWRAHYDLGLAAWILGDRARALRHLVRAWGLGAYGATGALSGGTDDPWRRVLESKIGKLANCRAGRGVRGFEAALISMLLDRPEDALSWLEEAEQEGSWALVMQYYPVFDGISAHPAFLGAMERVGLGFLGPPARN